MTSDESKQPQATLSAAQVRTLSSSTMARFRTSVRPAMAQLRDALHQLRAAYLKWHEGDESKAKTSVSREVLLLLLEGCRNPEELKWMIGMIEWYGRRQFPVAEPMLNYVQNAPWDTVALNAEQLAQLHDELQKSGRGGLLPGRPSDFEPAFQGCWYGKRILLSSAPSANRNL